MIVAMNKLDRLEFNKFSECAEHFGVSVNLVRDLCTYRKDWNGWSFIFTTEPVTRNAVKQDNSLENFSKNFSMLMKKTGKSYKKISIDTGLSEYSLKNIEKKPNVKLDVLLMLCKEFNKDPSWFFNPVSDNWR